MTQPEGSHFPTPGNAPPGMPRPFSLLAVLYSLLYDIVVDHLLLVRVPDEQAVIADDIDNPRVPIGISCDSP